MSTSKPVVQGIEQPTGTAMLSSWPEVILSGI